MEQVLKTTIGELKNIIIEYREQLRRMRINDPDNYPIMLNMRNDSGEIDDWVLIDGNEPRTEG